MDRKQWAEFDCATKAKLELDLRGASDPCGRPMSQGVKPAHCITVAPGLTRPLACGRIGIAESVLGEVEVSRRETW